MESATATTPCRAMAYYRLSKEDGANHESDSITNQRKLVQAYIDQHPDLTLVGEAQDDGYTGTSFDRPGFCAVMEAVKAGRADCVIVKDLSRLGREYIETGTYLERIFPSLGVRFIAINDDVDSAHRSAGDDILIPVKNIINESYCRELSKKLRRQFQVQRSNGEFLGAFAAYGYRKSPQDKHRLVPDDYAAAIVRDIFAWKLQGCSQQAIASRLNQDGILSPAAYKRQTGLNYQSGFCPAGGGSWSAATVRTILSNPLYIGTLVQGKRGTPNYKLKKMRLRDEADWVVVAHNHEAIIDPLLFAAVQKLLSRDTRTPPSADIVQPLAGVVFCADCGRAMCRRSVTRGSKQFYYYVCSTSKRGGGCASHSFSQAQLEQAVLHALQTQIQLVGQLDKLLDELGQSGIAAQKRRHLELLRAEKEQELARCLSFRMKLFDALQEGLISREEYDQLHQSYNLRIQQARQGAEQLQQAQACLQDDTAWAAQFLNFQSMTQLQREAVATLIDRIDVFSDKRLAITFNFKDEMALYQTLLLENGKEAG